MFMSMSRLTPARRRWPPELAIAAALALLAGPVAAGSISLGPGSHIDIGAGQIQAACSDIVMAGALAGSLQGARHLTFAPGAVVNQSMLGLSGNLTNQGPGALNAAVDWSDGCGVAEASMLGSHELARLHIHSATGKVIRFDSAAEQQVHDSLRLTGSSGNRLRLRSTTDNGFASLTLGFGASQQIDWVDVANIDSRAGQAIAPGLPADYNSLSSGPVRNWFGLPAVPVPSLGLLATLLLIALMGLFGLFKQRSDPFGVQGDNTK